ncbi:hypothetical protein ACSZNE_12005, partial [Aeromonas caviae]|uniref:hypothetical protein n=1 Tax=Aeromonas caviae TaxID=648 RepID=UPI003EC8840F
MSMVLIDGRQVARSWHGSVVPPKTKPGQRPNAVHLSGAALRFTGKRVFDIFTALGLDGLGRFS